MALLVLSDVQAPRPEGERHEEVTVPRGRQPRGSWAQRHQRDGQRELPGGRDNRGRGPLAPCPCRNVAPGDDHFTGKAGVMRDAWGHWVASPAGRGRPWLRLAFHPAGWPWPGEGALEPPARVSPPSAPEPGKTLPM